MITIRNYRLDNHGLSYVEMPADAIVLDVQYQPELGVMLWARVDTERPSVERCFNSVMTGERLAADPGIYLGTVQLGLLVVHYFELPRFVE